MFCHNCGTQIPNDLQFCTHCGQSLAGPPLGQTPAIPWTAPPGVRSHTGQWIGSGWRLVKADLGTYVLLALVYILMSGIPLIKGPMTAGFHIFLMKKLLGRRAEFSDLFTGFNFFVPTLVASLIIGLFVGVGLIFCIVGSLVVAAALQFTYLFIVDRRMDFWPAIQSSHAVVKQDYFGFTMFVIALGLLNLLGFICCLVGVLVTIPITLAAVTIAYQEIVGFDQRTIQTL
ncbi:MAG: zinc-ribbon domain-containing protein [Bryobacteraceae bacterium]|jgi:hypothetical protein